ncbi:MAG: hypothetical protein MJ109_03720 [Kiritimatiellae bacterium]|nr:hypothetical protein [Kiritimatiellia bacterium]
MTEEFQMGVTTKGLIALLQANLTDRYKDYFCIIQELLQNADDAEATTVVYGVCPKGLEVGHALAKLPGLYVINDGPVSRDNMAAIFSVAAGDKGNEKNKIGKFGLGMKSVFHACEGFFMFGKGHEEGIFPQFCTPWLGPYHKDWREDWARDREEMARQISQIVESAMPKSKRWFCVWLPLRSAKAEDGIYPIIGEYPGDDSVDELVCEDYMSQANRFLPMLKHVTNLRFVGADGIVRSAMLKANARLTGSSDSELSGYLLSGEKGDVSYEYEGFEKVDRDPIYEKLRNSPRWPKRSEFLEGQGMVSYKDKTSAHVAVCLLKESSNHPRVTVSPCVFLPLSGVREDADHYSVVCQGVDSFNLYLHGNFFVDAGRQEFDVGDDRHRNVTDPKDETSLRKVWNRTLFTRSVLPLVIPELEKAAIRWSGESFDAFMHALPEVKYLKAWQNELCATYRLLYTYGQTGWRWCKVPRHDAIYSFPEPGNATFFKKLLSALPEGVHLAKLEKGGLLGPSDIPRRDREFVSAVFEAAARMPVDELLSNDMLDFWEAFFDQFPNPNGAYAFWRRIISSAKIRKYTDFVEKNARLILRCRDCFTAFKDCRVTIKETPIWQKIASAADHRIPLPDADGTQLFGLLANAVQCDDGEKMMAAIRTLAESDRSSGVAYDMALLIAKSVGISNLSLECRQFPYWVIDDQSFSYERLIQLSEEGQLYRGRVDSREKQVFLSAVDWSLLRVSPEEKREGLVDALGLQAPLLGADLFISILKRTPKLKDVHSRCELVKLLIQGGSSNGYDWQLAVRYLVHGEPLLHGRMQELYYPAKDLPTGFAHIALSAITKAKTGIAYTIPEEISDVLSGPIRSQLMIHEVGNELLVQLLAETPGIQFSAFGDDSWKTLLMLADSVYYNEHTRTLIRKIPLFRTDDGRRVALGTDSFRQGKPEVPQAFRHVVKVIPDSGDTKVDERLAQVVSRWGYEDALKFSKKLNLSAAGFAEIVRPILHQLPSISDLNRKDVAAVSWIKCSQGYVSADKLLNLPGLRHVCESDDLVYPDDVADDELWQDLDKHHLIPSRGESLKRVFASLGEDAQYRIGQVAALGEFSAKDFLAMFGDATVMPVIQVLKECLDLEFDCDDALQLLRKDMTLDRYIAVANYLTDKVDDGARWLFPYLEEMSPSLARESDKVSSLRVICRDKSVKPTSDVCTYADGVSKEYLLNDGYSKHAPEFFKLLHDNSVVDRPPPDSALGSITDYFKDWDPNFNERICGFVYCCTDNSELLNYARVHWGLDGRGDPESWRNKICGELHRMMKGQQLKLWIYDTSEVEVVALDGSKLRLGLRQLEEGDTLFYGEGNPCRYDPMPRIRSLYEESSTRRLELKLRRLKPAELKKSTAVLDGVLCKTLAQIVHRLCDQWMVNVNGFWEELSNVEQVDIAVTRAKLLEKADVYLPMLRCEDQELRRHVKVWDEIGYEIQDVRKRPGGTKRYYELLSKKDEQLDQFAAAIESKPEVQRNILTAIREQMESYAYHRESILFELFQNADDAAEELRALYPVNSTGFRDRFSVDYDGKWLVVAHWGRQINQNKGIDNDVSAHPSFARDLEKMLMLMQSGKSGEGLKVTGKFGLGFKTVFFFSDEPIVMSGRLKFKIVGGFLPKSLDDAELDEMDKVWSLYSKGSGVLRPTVFVLPIRPDCRDRVDEALKAFAEHAQLSATFSRRIKHIDITFSDRKRIEIDGARTESSGEHLILRAASGANDQGAVVTGLRDGFPCPLSLTIPTYWVTVPTRQKLGAGFIINGKFELDTGRSNLNRAASKNIEAIECMGSSLEAALSLDYSSRKGQDNLVGFYESLWVVFSCCTEKKVWEHDSADLARGILWDEKSGGARRFFSTHPVLPSGLSGAYRVLTDVTRVRYVLTSELVDSPLSDIIGVAGLVPGTVVSGKLYPRELRQFVDGLKIEEFGSQKFFSEALKYIGCFSPEMANSVPGQKICELFASEDRRPESAQQFVDQVRFLADDGKTWASARDLVVDDGEESFKAAFCPKSAILSEQYDANGIKLFRKLRGHRTLSAEQLARYAASAGSEDRRICVLQYLLKKKDEEMAEFLAKELCPDWLDDVCEMTWFRSLSDEKRMCLASLLYLGLGAVSGSGLDLSENPISEIEIKKLTLDELRSWWGFNGRICLAKYNRRLYDRDSLLDLTYDVTDQEMRSEWLELFVLASACTLGMRDCQHKGFVRMLKERGYWNVYSRTDSTPDEWMDTLESFINLPAFEVEYQYWMRLFIRIYQFGRHLDGYVRYIQMWDHATESEVMTLRSIRGNKALTGTGIDVPDLEKAINDSGMRFLVRELIRRKALSNPALYVYGGLPSAFAGETFDGAFDLALKSYLNEHNETGVQYVY